MTKAEKIRNFYVGKAWSKAWVKDAVKQGWITEDEYKEIVGEDYEPDND